MPLVERGQEAGTSPRVDAGGGLGATIWSICAMRSRMAGRLIPLVIGGRAAVFKSERAAPPDRPLERGWAAPRPPAH